MNRSRRNFIKKASAALGALFALPFLLFGKKKPKPYTHEELMNCEENWRCNRNMGWHQQTIRRAYKPVNPDIKIAVMQFDKFPIRYNHK